MSVDNDLFDRLAQLELRSPRRASYVLARMNEAPSLKSAAQRLQTLLDLYDRWSKQESDLMDPADLCFYAPRNHPG